MVVPAILGFLLLLPSGEWISKLSGFGHLSVLQAYQLAQIIIRSRLPAASTFDWYSVFPQCTTSSWLLPSRSKHIIFGWDL